MAAPLDPNVPANGDSPFFGAAEIRALKQFLIDLWGIPPAPAQVTTPIGSTSTGGVFTPTSGFVLPDVAPTVLGQLGRSGAIFRYHSGLQSQNVSVGIGNQNPATTVANTVLETQLSSFPLFGGMMGTTGRLRFTAYGQVNSIVNAQNVQLRINFIDIGVIVATSLFGGSINTRTGLPWRIVFELWMNGALNSWRATLEAVVGAFGSLGSADVPGFAFSGGPVTSLTDANSGATDLSVNRTIQLACVWSNASASNSISCYHSMAELIP